MPILNRPSPSAPLTQGDILKAIGLFATDADQGGAKPNSYRVKSPLCMVISRPCAAIHKQQVVVASIEKITRGIPKDLDTTEKVCEFLEQLRDGLGSPDRFYLGQEIPGHLEDGRFFARLDSLHTVRLPSGGQLDDFIKEYRVAMLAEDFRRDLHRRIFSAYAALGFDDYGWYPDRDLEWVIAVARNELAAVASEVSRYEAEIAKNTAEGLPDRNASAKKKVADLGLHAREIKDILDKFEMERSRRSIGAAPQDMMPLGSPEQAT